MVQVRDEAVWARAQAERTVHGMGHRHDQTSEGQSGLCVGTLHSRAPLTDSHPGHPHSDDALCAL